jgi:hypothetical protein
VMASRRFVVAIDEAVFMFRSSITHRQLAALIAALGIRPVGKRQEPRRGRPRLTYDLDELQRLHAAVSPWLAARSVAEVPSDVVGLTIDEAASLLDPPITRHQLAGLIEALGMRPVGTRHLPRKGRPARTYDAAELVRLHAAVALWLPRAET